MLGRCLHSVCFLGPGILLSSFILAALPGSAAPSNSGDKGARIYCYMRSNNNDHAVSWQAAYALIKRQGSSLFKTSPEHAAVMITETVVDKPEDHPGCARFLGDLFGRSSSNSYLPDRTEPAAETPISVPDAGLDRYSY